jgi:hypothetical protein
MSVPLLIQFQQRAGKEGSAITALLVIHAPGFEMFLIVLMQNHKSSASLNETAQVLLL